MTPCKGVFADVTENKTLEKVEEIAHFKIILDFYKKYKTGFKDEKYANEIKGLFLINNLEVQSYSNYFSRITKTPKTALGPDSFCNT